MKVNLSIAKASSVRIAPSCDTKHTEASCGILYRASW